MTYRSNLYTRIESVDRKNWDRLSKQSFIGLDRAHLKAIEKSGINEIKPYYFTFYNGNMIVGIAYFFVMNLDISKLSGELTPAIRHTIKIWNPRFLCFRIIECGFIASLGESISYLEEHARPFFLELNSVFEEISRREDADFVIVRDIPYKKSKTMLEYFGSQYSAFLGYPSATLEIRWRTFEEYLNSLTARQRRNIIVNQKALRSDRIAIKNIADFDQYASRLEELWLSVSRKSDNYQHEEISKRYFTEMNRCLGRKSSIIAITYDDTIVASAFCLIGTKVLSFLHAGIDYELNEKYKLYFNLYICCIKEAIRQQISIGDFGLTTYFYKCKIGCELQPLVYFVKHLKDSRLTLPLAEILRSGIKQPENNHRPFSYQDITEREQLAEKDIRLRALQLNGRKDVFQKAHHYYRIGKLRIAGLYSFFPPFESAQDAVIQYQGRRVILLGTNSYLGLANHPEVKQAAIDAVEKYGTGCSGSPCLNGTLDLHERLIRHIADFVGKEDAIILGTGYQTNVAVLTGIVGRGDTVIIDALDHASLIDGARFSRSQIVTYKHNDPESLERALKKSTQRAPFVVIDAVFSMEGTIVDLASILEVSKRYKARVLIDEAHSLGVVGPQGRGVAALSGLSEEVDLIMGTFSKSFGAVGGFVAGETAIIEYLRHVCRPHIFSASLPPPVVAAVIAAMSIAQQDEEGRARVLFNAQYLSQHLEMLGYSAPFRGTAIVPVHCGNEVLTLAFYQKLLQEGVFVNPVLSPAVPKGRELIRTSSMATHDRTMLDEALEVFASIRTASFPPEPLVVR